MPQLPKNDALEILESDLLGLPAHTRKFVKCINQEGLDRVRIHGLFVMVGLCSGAPNTEQKINELFQTLELAIPIDRSKNIDEFVGHVYCGYDREISEFCYRSGAKLEFREMKIPQLESSFYIVKLEDQGLFDIDVTSVEKLADASRLYDAFILAIGRATAKRQASLVEAFGCGMFQILLHAKSDVSGSMQIAELIKSCLPLVYSRYFYTLQGNSIEYFLGLESGQVPLLDLMQPMDLEYAKQMWGFQSSLFFRDQVPIGGVDGLTIQDWHAWVLQNAQRFDADYPTELMPFSGSNIELLHLPRWRSEVEIFEICDAYINNVWGYSASSICGAIATLEYKALLVHLVYSSLTSARERLH